MISTLATATTANEQHGTQAQTGHAIVDAGLCSRARRLAPAALRPNAAGAALVVIPATRVSSIAPIGAWTNTTVDANSTLVHATGFATNHVSSFTAEWIGGYPTMAKKDHSQRERPT